MLAVFDKPSEACVASSAAQRLPIGSRGTGGAEEVGHGGGWPAEAVPGSP